MAEDRREERRENLEREVQRAMLGLDTRALRESLALWAPPAPLAPPDPPPL